VKPWDRTKVERAARKVAEERLRLEKIEARSHRWDFPIPPSGLYGYARASNPAQAKGSGLERQREVILEYCKENDFDVSGLVMIEEIAGAFKAYSPNVHIKRRFGKFIEWAKAGKLGPETHLFFEDVDRFSRLGAEPSGSIMDDLRNSGVTLHFIWNDQVLPRKIKG
jgi:DNA invertase Pin-like site-specific DNA recombinase